jgi:hypothetical protein
MRRTSAVVGAVAALAAVVAAPASAASGITDFRSPSGNIYCSWDHLRLGGVADNFLRCDVQQLAHRAPRPASCQFGFGSSFGISPRGRARALCVSDSVFDPSARVLAYGHTLRLGAFRCTSRSTGMRCSNADAHGFVLSRSAYRFF